MTTGERIKDLRVQLGMSQAELGAKIGVKTPAVYKYENGLVVNLKRSTIDSLAIALETTPSYLMGFDDEEKPTPVSESGPSAKAQLVYDRLSKLTPENLDIALAQLDVLLTHQEKRDTD